MKIETFFDFCSGIGGGRLGLEQAGLKCIGRSETSRLSDTTYRLMHNTDNDLNYGNLKKITADKIPYFDLLIAGFPCQTFSVIGRQKGFSDDPGQIIFHLSRILKEVQPACFILENVKGLVTHDKGNTIKIILNELTNSGYTVSYRVLSSIDYGVPQMRQRVYFIGFKTNLNLDYSKFEWPNQISPPPLNNFLIDNKPIDDDRLYILKRYLLNSTNNGKYTIEDIRKMESCIIDTRMNDLRIYFKKCPTLRAQRDGILYIQNYHIFQLTGYEALLLQGFPKNYADKVKLKVTDRHLLMQAGNAMTVNIIKSLGESMINFLNSQNNNIGGSITMNPGEKFETQCYEYLKRNYLTESINFYHEGGMDSTKSDIAVIKNGKTSFYIEIKDNLAQSGQFVLLPNTNNKTFDYSPRNHSPPNKITNIIIEYMNSHFKKFNEAGTSGEKINIDKQVFSNWIINHYLSKNVKYIMSYNNDYVIFPIRKFDEYFDIIANYRIKKSGSREPAKKDIDFIKQCITDYYYDVIFTFNGRKIYAEINEPITKDRFILGNYTYFLSPYNQNKYEIRKLSNTRNMNVIFSIKLINCQNIEDLKEFEHELKS